MEVITITIDEKKPYVGEAERHPFGDFYENRVKYTCWDEPLFNQFNIGDRVEIAFTSKSNEYNGRTFTNRNISTIKIAPQVVSGREVEVIRVGDEDNVPTKEVELNDTRFSGYPNSELIAGNVFIEGKQYEIIVRLV